MPRRIRAGEKYLNARFTFDNFVVGECNEFAYSVSKALAHYSYYPYSSLFLLASTGFSRKNLRQRSFISQRKILPTR